MDRPGPRVSYPCAAPPMGLLSLPGAQGPRRLSEPLRRLRTPLQASLDPVGHGEAPGDPQTP